MHCRRKTAAAKTADHFSPHHARPWQQDAQCVCVCVCVCVVCVCVCVCMCVCVCAQYLMMGTFYARPMIFLYMVVLALKSFF